MDCHNLSGRDHAGRAEVSWPVLDPKRDQEGPRPYRLLRRQSRPASWIPRCDAVGGHNICFRLHFGAGEIEVGLSGCVLASQAPPTPVGRGGA